MYSENMLLKPQIANKDRIIFEQLKVIQNLSPKVSNAVFEESTNNNLHFISDTSENSKLIETLAEENDRLKSEIEELKFEVENLRSECEE